MPPNLPQIPNANVPMFDRVILRFKAGKPCWVVGQFPLQLNGLNRWAVMAGLWEAANWWDVLRTWGYNLPDDANGTLFAVNYQQLLRCCAVALAITAFDLSWVLCR